MAAVASQTSILIVDDHRDTADMIRRFLGRKNIACEVVENASDAMSLIGTKRPLCIILDEWMPGTTGLAFLKQLRAHPEYHDVPVVFYSAAFDMNKQTEAESLGAKGWFVKGVARLDDLAAKVIALCQAEDR
jgi:DNA-binding response OmpR family regulator